MSDRPRSPGRNELHAYVDGQLDGPRRAEIDAWLAENPTVLAQVIEYREQRRALQALFDPVLRENVPRHLSRPIRRWERRRRITVQAIAAVALFAFGGIAGALLGRPQAERPDAVHSLAREAVRAHRVFTGEQVHPVEVAAGAEAHLVDWLSERLAHQLTVPNLHEQEYRLIGGRLLPSPAGQAAQFMYEDPQERRLTLFIRNELTQDHVAPHFTRQEEMGAVIWRDGRLGFAVIGDAPPADLMTISHAVLQQFS